jgi:hypothetical protein
MDTYEYPAEVVLARAAEQRMLQERIKHVRSICETLAQSVLNILDGKTDKQIQLVLNMLEGNTQDAHSVVDSTDGY